MMCIKIELRNFGDDQFVKISLKEKGIERWYVTPDDFKRACCEAFGLVDFHSLPKHVQGIVVYSNNQTPDSVVETTDEFCRKHMAEKTQRDADHASEALAAASRRLA